MVFIYGKEYRGVQQPPPLPLDKIDGSNKLARISFSTGEDMGHRFRETNNNACQKTSEASTLS